MSKQKQSDDLDLGMPEAQTGEDRKQFGWPGISKLPFVGAEYYRQFDQKLRPRFGAGGPMTFNLSNQDMARVQEIYARPFPLATYINMSMTEHHLTIVGATPGSIVEVVVPPFGVLRGDPDQLGKIGQEGASYWTFYPIGPAGDCGGADSFKDAHGALIESCKRTNCSRHPSNGLVHSVHHALHFIASVGDAYQSPMDRKMADGEPPDEDDAQTVIMQKYAALDPRPAVQLFAGKRTQWLRERKAKRTQLRTDANARLAQTLSQSSS
jgi:hypothetical protein